MDTTRSGLLAYGVAPVAVAAALGLTLVGWTSLRAAPTTLFYAAITIAAWMGGLGPGLLATALAAIGAETLLLAPARAVTVGPGDVVRVAAFLFVGAVISGLCAVRIRAERAHRSSEARLQAILDHTAAVVYVKGLDGRYLFVNRQFERLFHVTRAGARARTSHDLFPAAMADRFRENDGRALAAGAPVEFEETVPHDDGLHTYVSIKFPLADARGAVYAVCGISTDITERTRAQAEVVRQREWLRVTLGSIGDAVIATDARGHVTFLNAVAETLTGWREDEAHGEPLERVFRIVDEHTRAPVESPVPRVLREGTVGAPGNHTTLIARDGTATAIDDSGAPIRDAAGEVIGVVLVFRDASARRRVQRAERRAQEHATFFAEAGRMLAASLDYAETLDTAARLTVPTLCDWCVIHVVEDDGSLRRVDTAVADPARAEVARALERRSTGIDTNAPAGRLARALATGQTQLVAEVTDEWLREVAHDAEHLELLRRVGMVSLLHVPLTVRGRVVAVMTLARSDPERRFGHDDVALAEELAQRASLAVDNARLYADAGRRRREAEVIAELARSLNASLDLDGVLARVVDGARELTVCDGARIVLRESGDEAMRLGGLGDIVRVTGRPFRSPSLREDARIGREHRSPADTEGSVAAMVVPLVIQGQVEGLLYVDRRAPRPFTDRDEAILLQLADHAAIALGNLRLLREAQTANRAKDEFLATLSHELRTPLTAVMGWVRMLRTGPLDAATTSRALETIERNSRLQAQLIEDLLDVSRIITGKMRLERRPVDLAPVIEAALDAVRGAADGKGVALAVHLDAGAGLVAGDPDRLQQVVWNLLSNGIKFTPRGGRVEVRLAGADSRVRISVSDSGRGIPPGFLPYVFERFRQVDSTSTRAYGGLGLGLAIVRHLVEAHGGTVEARSEGEGLGSTFVVELPLMAAREDSGLAAISTPPTQAVPGPRILEGLRLLVVDDESDARNLLTTILDRAGARVWAAGSTAEALEALGRVRPHVLVSDIGLPLEDGYALIRRVRALAPAAGGLVPALALTAYARADERTAALLAGFQMHLAKPVEPSELIAAVAGLARLTPDGPDAPRAR